MKKIPFSKDLNFIKNIKIRIAVPSTILNPGARNTFGGGGRRDGRGGGEGVLGGLGGRGGAGGLGGSARDEFEFSSWPTPSSHCWQSMAAAAKEKVSTLSFSQNLLMGGMISSQVKYYRRPQIPGTQACVPVIR